MQTQNHGFPSVTAECFLCRKYFAYFLVKKIFGIFCAFLSQSRGEVPKAIFPAHEAIESRGVSAVEF